MSSLVANLDSERAAALIKDTVAKDLDDAEFNLFMHMARVSGLDPRTRQIYAIVYNADKPHKRRVTFQAGIDGYRAIADRTGTYRPGERMVVTNPEKANPDTNPHGIESATVTVWKYAQGSWHEYSETVWWDEYAPLQEVWENNRPTGRFRLGRDSTWRRMGRIMLMKCAEAAALRRGWPENFAGINVAEEMEQAGARSIDVTPAEQAEAEHQRQRAAQVRLAGPAIVFQMHPTDAPAAIPVPQVIGKVMDYINEARSKGAAGRVVDFWQRNSDALKQYFQVRPDEHLEIKRQVEAAQAAIDKRRATEAETVTAAAPPASEPEASDAPAEEEPAPPPKRGRGRPRKNPA